MADFIDREAVLTEIYQYTRHYWPTVSYVESIIQKQPAADVAQVVHGRWIDNGANGYKWAFVCSRCGYADGHPFDNRHNFCPNCGARMDGGGEDG